MASIDRIRSSDGSENASMATVQSTRAPAASTIVVDTVAGIPDNFMGSMGTPHTFTDPITSEVITVISEATAVDFSGHVDGSNLEIDDIAPGYADGGSEIGDIVIIRPTTQWGDNVADVLDVSHDDDGTLNTSALTQIKTYLQAVVGWISTAMLANNSVTSAKLAVALRNATPGTLSDIGTSFETGATISLPAGTWFVFAKANTSTSVAQSTAFTGEIYNSTDAAIIDTCIARSEYVSGTEVANSSIINGEYVTVASTKSIIVRYKVDDSSGTSSVNNIKLFAIPIGV